ncbi:DUF4232 domain-containing protein [Streptosporangium amethystogenes]|uniref:DUF4232 domain-containing protein n=1 Tax=Streptosporangium amethystogenes TaxID=2002 RepID=UPI001B7FF0AF|nr:DUF4232 domain-containing protein [Streptosporangium amethystogenes]
MAYEITQIKESTFPRCAFHHTRRRLIQMSYATFVAVTRLREAIPKAASWNDRHMNTVPVETRRTHFRRLGLLLTTATLVTSCGTPPPAKPLPPASLDLTPSPSVSRTSACPKSGAVITTGEIDAAMGLRALNIVLTNCGTRAYRVNGYPTIRVLDGDGKPLDVKVSRGSSSIALIDDFDATPKPATLKPGEKTVAGLVWRNTVLDSPVAPVNGSYLEITPAPGERSQIVPQHIDLGTTGKLGVTAWK